MRNRARQNAALASTSGAYDRIEAGNGRRSYQAGVSGAGAFAGSLVATRLAAAHSLTSR